MQCITLFCNTLWCEEVKFQICLERRQSVKRINISCNVELLKFDEVELVELTYLGGFTESFIVSHPPGLLAKKY